MGSAFHQLCPRYSGTLTPTAPTAIRLWDTFTLPLQCKIITFRTLKYDIIQNSRIELRGIVLPVPSNQIKITFNIILPFNLEHLSFFPVSHRN